MSQGKEHKPSAEQREMVQAMSGYGVPQEDICHILDVSLPTLHKHYRRELDVGMAKANAKIGESLYKQATSGNTSAAIFWLKARAGWREKHEIVGRAGGAIEVDVNHRHTGVPRPEDFKDPAILKAIVDAMNASKA